MLHHVPSFDWFANNRSILGEGVLLYVRDAFNVNKMVNFSVKLEHLETIFVLFWAEINYFIGNVYRPLNSNNDDFMSEHSNILNNALTYFRSSTFYAMGDF